MIGCALIFVLATGCGRSALPPGTQAVSPLRTAPAGASLPPPAASTSPPTPGQTASSPTATFPPPELAELQVVYVRGGNLWLWTAEGNRPLTQQGSDRRPLLSPDGRLVAFVRQVDALHDELWVLDLASGESRRLVGQAEFDQIGAAARQPGTLSVVPNQIAWVPGTYWLAFNTRQIFQGPGWGALDDLNLVHAETGQVSYVLLAGWGGNFAFSPDGERVALSTPTQLILARRDGSGYRQVLNFPYVLTYGEIPFYPQPHWSAAGDRLWVVIPPADALAEPVTPYSIWTVAADGERAEKRGEVLTARFLDNLPVFSPDLRRLAFTRLVEADQSELVLAAVDGSDQRVYGSGWLLRFLAWSPSGERWLFSVGDEQELWLGQEGVPGQAWPGALRGLSEVRWIDETTWLAYWPVNQEVHLVACSLEGGFLVLDRAVQALGYTFFSKP